MLQNETLSFVIANGGTESGLLSAQRSKGQVKLAPGSLVDMIVYTPDALTNTLKAYISPVYPGDTADWRVLANASGDIAFAANKAIQLTIASFRDLKFVSSGAEAAERTIKVAWQLSIST